MKGLARIHNVFYVLNTKCLYERTVDINIYIYIYVKKIIFLHPSLIFGFLLDGSILLFFQDMHRS